MPPFPVVLCIANPASKGGTELQVEIIAEALKKRFGSCLVLISGTIEGKSSSLFLKRLKILNIPYRSLGRFGLIPYYRLPFLTKLAAFFLKKALFRGREKAPPPICHFFNPASTLLAPVLKKAGGILYYMETGMPSLEKEWQVLGKTAPLFHHVFSVSSEGLRRLKRFYGYQGPFSLLPSLFHPPDRKFFCKEPQAGKFDIVYFGRMTPNKGVALLLDAFSQLLPSFPFARLFLIGSGESVTAFKAHAENLRISEKITWEDWLEGDALFSRLVEMDLFSLPSFAEGLPCSILEAMSLGLPIVAADVGGISEVLEHNVSGILVPPRDGKALAQAFFRLAAVPLERQRLRKEAFSRSEKLFSKEALLERLIAIYERGRYAQRATNERRPP